MSDNLAWFRLGRLLSCPQELVHEVLGDTAPLSHRESLGACPSSDGRGIHLGCSPTSCRGRWSDWSVCRPLDAITQLFGVQRSRNSLGRLHPGDDCAVQADSCGRDVFMVCEDHNLEVLRQFMKDLESLVGATVVKGDQRVVEDERQRWFAPCQAIGVLFRDGREPERQEDLVSRSLGQSRRFERLAVATQHTQRLRALIRIRRQSDPPPNGETFEDLPRAAEKRARVLVAICIQRPVKQVLFKGESCPLFSEVRDARLM
jgi:hypothetical protein